MEEQVQPEPEPQATQGQTRNPLRAAETFFKNLPIGLRHIIGVAFIFWLFIVAVAVLHPSLTERWKFGMDMTLNLLILLVVGVQAYIYTGQWQVMREQSDKMERSFVLANRASVCVHSIEMNKTRKVVLVKVENIGNMPAEQITLLLKLVSFGPVEGIESDNPRQEIKSSAVREDYGGTKLFKGNLPILLSFYLTEWTESDLRSIEKGKINLMLIGYLEYGDGFSEGPDKRTEFCFNYQPEIDIWSAGPTEYGDMLGWGDDEAG